MAAPTLGQMREALAASLSSLDVQVSPYVLANPTPPCIHIYPAGPAGDITYDLAFGRGLDLWPFTVQAFVALTGDVGSQKKLDELLAPSGVTSIKQLLEADGTLGGLVDDVTVVSCGGYRTYVRDGGGPCLGAEFHVQVLASGR